MIEKWTTTLPKLSGTTPRTVYVYTPDSYNDDHSLSFPVLYMFDGHNVFFDEDATYGKSWGMKEYMDYTNTPMMIVAVECSHSPNNGRLCEYSPFSFQDEEFGKVTGKGKKYMDWLVSCLKPVIDAQYPTIPDREHTYIAGSSMGGLMTVYALTKYSEYFSRGAALSPSLWICHKAVMKMIRSSDYPADTVLYMDYGSRELNNHEPSRKVFCAATNELVNKGVFVTSRIVPNGEHCEACWEEQVPIFMEILQYERE